MVRHIVAWKFAAEQESERAETFAEMRRQLEALVGVVPGLRSLTVSRDLGVADGNWQAVLVSEHDDAAALQTYQDHPDHRQAAAFVADVTTDRVCIDTEL